MEQTIALVNDSFEDYLSNPAISASDIVLLYKSAKQWKAQRDEVSFEDEETSEEQAKEKTAQLTGSVLHCLVLEPEKINDYFYLLDETQRPEPEKTFASKKNKVWKIEVQNANAGKKIISKSIYMDAYCMSVSVKKNPAAMDLLKGGYAEHSFYTNLKPNPDHGFPARIRPDYLVPGSYFVSLKTTRDASPVGWKNECKRYHYDAKEAFYMRCLQKLPPDMRPMRGYFICVENVAPAYECVVYDMNMGGDWMDSPFFLSGAEKMQLAFDRLRDIDLNNNVRGYDEAAENGILSMNWF